MRLIGLAVGLTLSLVLAPLAGETQQSPAKVHRIGVLETTSPALNTANLDAFRHGLRELGYVEGRNLIIDYRSADGRSERFRELAVELVRLQADVIVTRGTPAALAAKNATATIPIVMAAIGEPLDTGVVASLARPGGNVTGLTSFGSELMAKRLELLREAVPRASQIGALFNMSNPVAPPQWKEIEKAARSLGIQAQLFNVQKSDDVTRAFDAAIRHRADALIIGSDTITQLNRQPIAELAARHRLPAIYFSKEFVEIGGLMSYGPSYPHLYYRAAGFVDKLLKGAKPADLPVEQPTKFELVINLKTAKALGLTIPQSILVRADELIQ